MDPYVEEFQSRGGSLIMIGKGNRGQEVVEACKKYGGFYLGSIGGPAAILAQNHIKKLECVEYPELGMEAIWKIEVEDFPAFILIDDKGNDFFKIVQAPTVPYGVEGQILRILTPLTKCDSPFSKIRSARKRVGKMFCLRFGRLISS